MTKFTLIILLYSLFGCQQLPSPKLLRTPSLTWLERHNSVVGIVSIEVDDNISVPASFNSEIENNLISLLKKKEHLPIESQLYQEIESEIFSTEDNLYSSLNGNKDITLESRLYKTTMDEYLQRYKPDFMISLHFYRTVAEFREQTAKWDNVEDSSGAPFLISVNGNMPAISVSINGYNPKTKEVFNYIQGVQSIFENDSVYDIRLEDIDLHLKNLEAVFLPLMTFKE